MRIEQSRIEELMWTVKQKTDQRTVVVVGGGGEEQTGQYSTNYSWDRSV